MKRRDFVKIAGIAGVGSMVPWKWFGARRLYAAPVPGGTMDPELISKFQMPLVKPPAMPPARGNAPYYEIAVREFTQQILPTGPETTVWSYGSDKHPGTVAQGGSFFYPAFTVENKFNRPTKVKWINGLDGKQHLLPVDPSLHWANPIGRRDSRPNPVDDPTYWDHQYIDQDGRYTGPVPMVTHVHGAHVNEESDGYPEAWWLPASASGVNFTHGRYFDYFMQKYPYLDWGPGYVNYTYHNQQRATTLWYHDHTLGMTRLNVYAGPAGFWLIRGGLDDRVKDLRTNRNAVLPGPAPGVGANPFGTYYEIPIVIQDRSFNGDNSLWFPDNRAFFEGLDRDQLQVPFTFDQLGINPNSNGWGLGCDGGVSDVAPIWNPEFFGNVMVVNGRSWPYLDVEQRRYRFRLLNGCNARFLVLKFDDARVDVWQIGSDGGFLPAPVRINDFPADGDPDGIAKLLVAPAERYDVIVDFTNVPVGTEVLMLNIGPDEPFGGFDFDAADPETTGQVMQFRVTAAQGIDPSTPPQYLQLPSSSQVTPNSTRYLSLNEEESANVRVSEDLADNLVYDCGGEPFGPTAALVGTYDPNTGTPQGLRWMAPITENPSVGASETWEIHNFTMDAHPIHVHLIQFQVVGREPIGGGTSSAGQNDPLPWETGWKDTVIAYPGEITRIKMRFDQAGLYVWHCHIIDHEDNEMMRPYHVGPIPANSPQPGIKYADNQSTFGAPRKFTLEQNYPNPFNPSTQIRFQLPRDEKVQLEIYNSLGQKVRTLISQVMPAGDHEVLWDAKDSKGKNLASGMYIYRIKAGTFTQVKRMSLVR